MCKKNFPCPKIGHAGSHGQCFTNLLTWIFSKEPLHSLLISSRQPRRGKETLQESWPNTGPRIFPGPGTCPNHGHRLGILVS